MKKTTLFSSLLFLFLLTIQSTNAQTEKDLYGTWVLEDMQMKLPDTLEASQKAMMENMMKIILENAKGKVTYTFNENGDFSLMPPKTEEEEAKEEKGTWKYNKKTKKITIEKNQDKSKEIYDIAKFDKKNNLLNLSTKEESTTIFIIIKKKKLRT
jgi:hypothetical protein